MRPRNFFSLPKAIAVNRGYLETSLRNIPFLVGHGDFLTMPPSSILSPKDTSMDCLIQQMSNYIDTSNGETKTKEEVSVPVKMEDVNIKTENIQNHEDGSFRCQYCIFEGKTSYILQRHIVKHTGPLKCSKCKMGFSSKGSGKDSHNKHEESCDGSNPLLLLDEGHVDLLQNNFVITHQEPTQKLAICTLNWDEIISQRMQRFYFLSNYFCSFSLNIIGHA